MSDVTVIIGNGNLGRASEVLDGVAALIGTGVSVAGGFALGDVLALRSLADAEGFGITELYDDENSSLLWHHIRAFYENGGEGSELYVLPVANTVTLTQMADKTGTHAPALLASLAGRVRLLGITRVPPAEYAPVSVNQFDPDVFTAAVKLQELAVSESAKHRPIQCFIEGRGFSGDASSVKQLRDETSGLNANRVSVVIGQDSEVTGFGEYSLNSAGVGIILGRVAAIPVQRNAGRVKDGSIQLHGEASVSSGELVSAFTDAELTALNSAGYVMLIRRDGTTGYFVNNDHTACPLTDDYAYVHRGRVIDKAARLVRSVYLQELLDDVDVDAATGKLAASVVKNYQRLAEKSVEVNMLAKSEISGVSVFVDPDQNILSTDKIVTVMRIVPKGMVNAVEVLLSFSNPSSL